MILDGWGIGDRSKSDAIYTAHPAYWNQLLKNIPTPNFRPPAKTSASPTARWVTRR